MGDRFKQVPRTATHYSVGGSDLLIFGIFENGHIATDQVYFYEFDSKKFGIFLVSLHFYLKFFLKTFPPSAGSKNVKNQTLFAHFRVTVKIFRVKFWNWGPLTILHNLTCVQFFVQ